MTIPQSQPQVDPAPLQLTFPAAPDHLTDVRHALQDWLAGSALPADLAYDVILAVTEACTNAVEHGYRDSTGTVRVTASITAALLRVVIADEGRWKPQDEPRDPSRGRGMAIIRSLIPRVEVTTGDSGTVVDLRIPLGDSPA